MNEKTAIVANITINTTDPFDPLLGNVSVCVNVTCAGGYNVSEKQYVNFTGTLQANITFYVTPPAVGRCNATTCVDCDDTIPELNETDNCENTKFNVILCQARQVPISPLAALAFIGIITTIAVTKIRK